MPQVKAYLGLHQKVQHAENSAVSSRTFPLADPAARGGFWFPSLDMPLGSSGSMCCRPVNAGRLTVSVFERGALGTLLLLLVVLKGPGCLRFCGSSFASEQAAHRRVLL